jgi:hypothetical protein
MSNGFEALDRRITLATRHSLLQELLDFGCVGKLFFEL